MSDERERAIIACPRCGHQIATAPEDELPKGKFVCPGCGAALEAPARSDVLVEEAKEKIKVLVEELIDPSKRK